MILSILFIFRGASPVCHEKKPPVDNLLGNNARTTCTNSSKVKPDLRVNQDQQY